METIQQTSSLWLVVVGVGTAWVAVVVAAESFTRREQSFWQGFPIPFLWVKVV